MISKYSYVLIFRRVVEDIVIIMKVALRKMPGRHQAVLEEVHGMGRLLMFRKDIPFFF